MPCRELFFPIGEPGSWVVFKLIGVEPNWVILSAETTYANECGELFLDAYKITRSEAGLWISLLHDWLTLFSEGCLPPITNSVLATNLMQYMVSSCDAFLSALELRFPDSNLAALKVDLATPLVILGEVSDCQGLKVPSPSGQGEQQ